MLAKVLTSIFTIFLVTVFLIGSSFIEYNNQEIQLRATIEAKQKDNQSEYDNMWKKISQVAQVTQGQKEALKDILIGYADARSGNSNNQIMTWIQESVPQIDTSTFNNLQNVITSSRDTFTYRQKELLDLKRQHDILLREFPSNIFLSLLGRKEIDIQIVTSLKSKESFKTGEDNDIKVF